MPLPLADAPAQIDRSAPSPLVRTSLEIPAIEPRVLELRVFELPALLRLAHLSSLDAPAVAVVWSLCFASAARIQLPAWVPLLLGLGTWSVYVADRLLDAHRALAAGYAGDLRERHFFHWRHRRLLIPLAFLAGALAAAIIFSQMPPAFRARNAVLAVAALFYFSGVHLPDSLRRIPASNRLPAFRVPFFQSKELLVGVLFTAGCAAPTFMRLQKISAASLVSLLFLIAYFACLAWLNCAAIDCWEAGRASHVVIRAIPLACVGALAGLVCAVAHLQVVPALAAGAASALLLGVLDRTRHRLTPLGLRCAADIVLLTPLLCLLR